MQQRLPVAESKSIPRVLVCALALCPMGFSQPSKSTLESTRVKLASLQTCLGAENSNLRDLTQGLLAGWGQWKTIAPTHAGPPSPPPEEYLDSLDRDIGACNFASRLKDDVKQQMILSAVKKDIAIKAEDCHRFGMGRMVSVRVFALRGSAMENGWEVFYKWNCSSDFQPDEMRAAQLTSPAIVQLPPGNYRIRAQKRNSDGRVVNIGPAMTIVGLQPTIDIQLPIQ